MIPYPLYSGSGNTFYMLDSRKVHPEYDFHHDADGIILLGESQRADFNMRILNRDGSEAEMCGNGLRCLIKFLADLGIRQSVYHIETLAGIYSGWIEEEAVCINMLPPSDFRIEQPYCHLNTGVPHTILFVHDIESAEVEEIGAKLRKQFDANINFVSVGRNNSIYLRTYERGVGETLACGTGATASALAASKLFRLHSPIAVHVRSGDVLEISFSNDWKKIILKGKVIHKQPEESVFGCAGHPRF